MKINEKNFIKQLKNKDERAINYILENYGWVIKSIVSKNLYNLKDYQDECINDILLALWNNIDKFDESKSTFKNWLAGISKYKTIDIQRKYLKTLDRENIDDLDIIMDDTIDKEIVKNELEENVNELLSWLKKEDRDLFIKVYVEEKEIDEVALDIGVKRDVIYNRLSRGKKKIKNVFKTV